MPQEDPRILELRQRRAKAMQGGGEERVALLGRNERQA